MEKTNILYEDIEYLIIENEETHEIIAKISQYESEVIKPYIIRIKPIPNKKDQNEV